MRLAAALALVCLGCTNSGLQPPADMADNGAGCAAFHACYAAPDAGAAAFVNCESGFSPLAIARAVELEDCKLIACLSDHLDAAPRRCNNATDSTPECVRCLHNAEGGGPLGACDPPSDPICGACSAEVAICLGL